MQERESGLEHPDKRVTPLGLDMTSAYEIERAAREIDALDVLINNAGVAIYDNLSNLYDRTAPGREPFRHVQGAARFLAVAETLKRGHRQQSVCCGPRTFTDHTRLLHF